MNAGPEVHSGATLASSGAVQHPKRCLLVIPRHFYTFEEYLRQGLEAKGFSVLVANDEYPEGMIGKVLGKLQIPLVFLTTAAVFARNFLDGKRFDLVLIFKGRGVSSRLIEAMGQVADRVVGYSWDSLRLNPSPVRWYSRVSRYATFDYRDAEELSLPVVELFSAARTVVESKVVTYEISAIVRNHTGRLKYIDQVLSALQPKSCYILIYEMNFITFCFNAVRNPILYFKYRHHISFKPLPYSEYSRVMDASEFTIDYAHDTQTGITMRCFEAVHSKTKIITNNGHIIRSPHFSPGDYVVFENGGAIEPLLEGYARTCTVPYGSQPRTVASFLDELLAE